MQSICEVKEVQDECFVTGLLSACRDMRYYRKLWHAFNGCITCRCMLKYCKEHQNIVAYESGMHGGFHDDVV